MFRIGLIVVLGMLALLAGVGGSAARSRQPPLASSSPSRAAAMVWVCHQDGTCRRVPARRP